MRKFLAFNISSRFIEYGVIYEDGRVLKTNRLISENKLSGSNIIDQMISIANPIILQESISGIAISTAGLVDPYQGLIIYASDHILDYSGLHIKDILEEKLNIPVSVENDVNCSALSESWVGITKDVKSMFYLIVGTGVGGGYVVDNRLHTGYSFSSGEIGYLPFLDSHLENYGSTFSLIEKISKKVGHEVTLESIIENYQKGHKIYVDEVNIFIDALSHALSTIVYVLNPEVIIIGGDLKLHKDFFQDLLISATHKKLILPFLENTKIEIADKLRFSRMIGALRNFLLQENDAPNRNFRNLINSKRDFFTKNETLVADFILANIDRVSKMTISEMALKIGISDPTITRFCKKIELSSYNELRILTNDIKTNKEEFDVSNHKITTPKDKYLNLMTSLDAVLEPSKIKLFSRKILREKFIYFFTTNSLKQELLNYKIDFLKKGIIIDVFSVDEFEYVENILEQKALYFLLNTNEVSKDIATLFKNLLSTNKISLSIITKNEIKESDSDCLVIPSSNDVFSLNYIIHTILEEF